MHNHQIKTFTPYVGSPKLDIVFSLKNNEVRIKVVKSNETEKAFSGIFDKRRQPREYGRTEKRDFYVLDEFSLKDLTDKQKS